MKYSRRQFLAASAALAAGSVLRAGGIPAVGAGSPRAFHLSISMEGLESAPERLAVYRDAGVSALWIGAFHYGHWPWSLDAIRPWLGRIEDAGMAAHAINVPLGHPGDALGSSSGTFPITPPERWQMGVRPDGTRYAGTSLHPPATAENCEALKQLEAAGVKKAFVDDDFRLAQGPGVIGGCFCDAHREAFLKRGGYAAGAWEELKDAVGKRSFTPILRAWVDYTCDQLTECFRAQQAAAPGIQLGNMVMYFGAEKAGIRLTDYAGVPLRVGEMMFNDASFGQLKNKSGELFSCLFHRRYVSPELAFSETTAYPANQLSAKNMAAKLAVSTLADVRNTMYMSGATPFPGTHWEVLAPAMRKQAEIHAKLAGHTPRGPFKHFWGEASRYVGDDNPFSLFLAAGVPFEVTDRPVEDGVTFLSDADARAVAEGQLGVGKGALMARASSGVKHEAVRVMEESLPELFALKRRLLPEWGNVPYVEEEAPVVCAWYPTARAVLLWNLSEDSQELTLRLGDTRRSVQISGLDVALIEEV